MRILLLHPEQLCAGSGTWSLQGLSGETGTPAPSRDAGAPTSLGDTMLPNTGSGEAELWLWLSPKETAESTSCEAGEYGGIWDGLLKPRQRMFHLSPSPTTAQ